MITDSNSRAWPRQGYNRIPLIAEAFADLETPLSLYLKLPSGRPAAQLPARIGRRRRALRALLVHRPAGAHAAARHAALRTEVVTDGEVVETHEGNPLDFIAAYQQRFKVALRPGLPRFCGGLAGYFGYDAVRYIEPKLARDREARRHRHARHPAAAVRGAGGHRQPLGPALPDRLCRPVAARGVLRARKRRLARAAPTSCATASTAPAVQRGAVARGRARVRQGRLPRGGAARPRNTSRPAT